MCARVKEQGNVHSWGSFRCYYPCLHPDCHFPSGKRSTSPSVPLLSSPLSAPPLLPSLSTAPIPFPADIQVEFSQLVGAVMDPCVRWHLSTTLAKHHFDSAKDLRWLIKLITKSSKRKGIWSLCHVCLSLVHMTEDVVGRWFLGIWRASYTADIVLVWISQLNFAADLCTYAPLVDTFKY